MIVFAYQKKHRQEYAEQMSDGGFGASDLLRSVYIDTNGKGYDDIYVETSVLDFGTFTVPAGKITLCAVKIDDLWMN